MTGTRWHARRGLTLTDLLITLCVVALLMAVVLPARQLADERRNRIQCAQHLRQIVLAMIMYSNQERNGGYPRLVFDMEASNHPTAYTAPTAKAPFEKDGPGPDDVTAGLFLLLRTQDITPDVFVCPSGKTTPWKGNVLSASNFDGPQHLSYSYCDPYPSRQAIASGFKFNNTLGEDFPLVADMNPGGDAVATISEDSSKDELSKANSQNHGGAGQNVVYGDGHIEFQTTPLCGSNYNKTRRDNIYARQLKKVGDDRPGAPADDKGGPIWGASTDAIDAVLLPAADYKTPK